MAGNVLEFTDANWKSEVLDSSVPVVVDFWAPWCGPCRMLAPTIEKLASEFQGRVKIGKLNTDENQETPGGLRISAIPTVLVFSGLLVFDTWRLRTTGRRALRAASVASQLSTELCVWTMPISSWRISRRKVTAAATSKALRIVRLNTERSAAEASARRRLAGWHAMTTSQPCSRSQRDSVRILISWPPSPRDDSVWSTTRRGDVDTRVSV